jgi:hypothetical protein
MLESGRNSLLESAQQATFISVATAALDRQCNKLAQAALSTKIHTRRERNNGVAGSRVPHPRGVFVFAATAFSILVLTESMQQSGFSVKKKPPSTHS